MLVECLRVSQRGSCTASADPDVLPPDAPVWAGPSKTAKMSSAARGVFSREWHARPENQISMFVGSGGSGEIGRKLAFEVAYKGATIEEVRVRLAEILPFTLARQSG